MHHFVWLFLQISRSKDPQAEISQGGLPMGVIPAGTLLRTEFSAFLPENDKEKGDKMAVRRLSVICIYTTTAGYVVQCL